MASRLYYYIYGQSDPSSIAAAALIDATFSINAAASVLRLVSAGIESVSHFTILVTEPLFGREELVAILLEPLRVYVSECWNDFNVTWKTWDRLNRYAGPNSVIHDDEMESIDEPAPSSFPDNSCQGFWRVLTAIRLKAQVEGISSIAGSLTIDGWVGSGPVTIASQSLVAVTATNLIGALASILPESSVAARLAPEPQKSRDYMAHLLADPIKNPTSRWADYNQQYKRYQSLQKLVSIGLMKAEELPPAPRVQDYTNLS
jgi:hypothetical protein